MQVRIPEIVVVRRGPVNADDIARGHDPERIRWETRV